MTALVVLGNAQGRKYSNEPLEFEIVRGLEEEDIESLLFCPPLGTKTPNLKQITHVHHQIAQMSVQGMSPAAISAALGISTIRIYTLRDDPSFKNLLLYYQSQSEQIFQDALAKMNVLGSASVDILQSRLEESPEAFSNRELMEVMKLSLLEGRSYPGGPKAAGEAGGVVVNVQFVGAEGPLVDGKLSE